VNVWLALVADGHVHHERALRWYESTDPGSRIIFCRIAQIGLLRLLTTDVVMRTGVLNQDEAWSAYDRLLEDERISLVHEPPQLEGLFREITSLKRPAPKDWGDSYLIAFAKAFGYSLVTFDRAMAEKASTALLLQS
jgi:toxin-antitoxin system PIN domain toxin